MEHCDINIDKDGIWYYRGAHMFRKEILCIFFEHLKIDDCGKYYIELEEEISYLEVEDTAFVVSVVNKTKNQEDDQDQIDVVLTDDSTEKLELTSLRIGKDNVLYCRVKEGRFAARFSRSSYYQLAEYIEQENDTNYFIELNDQKYFINCNE